MRDKQNGKYGRLKIQKDKYSRVCNRIYICRYDLVVEDDTGSSIASNIWNGS